MPFVDKQSQSLISPVIKHEIAMIRYNLVRNALGLVIMIIGLSSDSVKDSSLL